MKRQRPSGAFFKKQRRAREKEDGKAADAMAKYLKADPGPSGSGAQKPEQEEQGQEVQRARSIEEERLDGEGAEKPIEEARNKEDESAEDLTLPQVSPCISQADFSMLPFGNVTRNLRDEIIRKGAPYFQHSEGPFAAKEGRKMTKFWFNRKLGNGQGVVVHRSWLIYSPLKEAAYCFCCCLFPFTPGNAVSNFESPEGFSKWKDMTPVSTHERTPWHRKSFSEWKLVEELLSSGQTIDCQLLEQLKVEKERGKHILKAILECIKFLAKRNLALRGSDDVLADEQEDKGHGNFLCLIHLVSKFDPVVKDHLENAKKGRGGVTYLSPTSQNEFISLLGDKVRKFLTEEIIRAKYYCIMCDSTPDAAHQDQHSIVLRYVQENTDSETGKVSVNIKETFLSFVQFLGKDAASIEQGIRKFLESLGIEFKDCRAACFDNAAVMAGAVSGVQTRMRHQNERILFINCDNHNLNLAGVHAVSQDVTAVTFFETLDSVFTFFSRSTERWNEMKKATGLTAKAASTTRWSARSEEVWCFYRSIDDLLPVIERLCEDPKSSPDTKSECVKILKLILQFKFLCHLEFWATVLLKINRVQKRLQSPKLTFVEAHDDLLGLTNFLTDNRDRIVEEALTKSKERCEAWGIEINEQRIRRKKRMPGEQIGDEPLTPENEMKRKMYAAVDRLKAEISNRSQRLAAIESSFGDLFRLNVLLSLDQEGRQKLSQQFAGKYATDVNATELEMEIEDIQMFLKHRKEKPANALEFLGFLSSHSGLCPNLQVALRILLTIGTSIASCERSFSKLKLIKSYLRSTMGQARLQNLALMSIEKEVLDCVNFDEVIDNFAAAKTRKMNI